MWIKTQKGVLRNLDYVTEIYVRRVQKQGAEFIYQIIATSSATSSRAAKVGRAGTETEEILGTFESDGEAREAIDKILASSGGLNI